jgi:hypothetical protein
MVKTNYTGKSGVLQFEPDKNNGGILKFKTSIEDIPEAIPVIATQEPSQLHYRDSKNNNHDFSAEQSSELDGIIPFEDL